jgi:Transmembrane exosortase (Exosortase_EpsH)
MLNSAMAAIGVLRSSLAKQPQITANDFNSAQSAASRSAVLRWAVIILGVNWLLAIVEENRTSTLPDLVTSLLSVGVFQYMAWFAVFRLLGAADRTKMASNRDWAVVLGLCLIVFLPNRRAAWIAATAIGLYFALLSGGDRKVRSCGIVLLALSGQEFWGRQLFELIASPLLRAEAAVVGTILQTMQHGAAWQDNIITDQSGWSIVIYPFCSSFHNVSLALLCWVTVSRLARDTWQGRDFAIAGLIGLAMIAMNVTRLLLMSFNQNLYHYWHDGAGSQIFAIGASLFVLLASLYAARRAGEHG